MKKSRLYHKMPLYFLINEINKLNSFIIEKFV